MTNLTTTSAKTPAEQKASRILSKISTAEQLSGGMEIEDSRDKITLWKIDAERLGGDRAKALEAQIASEERRLAGILHRLEARLTILEARRERVKAFAGITW